MGAEVIVVVGAAGGVGASTLAALLARRRAADGGRVALVDLDHDHGGSEVLLGVEDRPGARWADLEQVRGTVAPADLEGVLPRWGSVEVLSGDRQGRRPCQAAVEAVWHALVGGCATVVVDLPAHAMAGTGAGEREPDPAVAALVSSRTDLLLVTGQDVLGVGAALVVRRAAAPGPVQLVLRRRRSARVAPLEAAHVLDAPLLALLPADRRVAEAVDRGFGPLVPDRSRLGRAVVRVARGAGRG